MSVANVLRKDSLDMSIHSRELTREKLPTLRSRLEAMLARTPVELRLWINRSREVPAEARGILRTFHELASQAGVRLLLRYP